MLSKKACDVDGVPVGEFRCGSRRREIVNARVVFPWLAVREGHSGAEVTRFLGVTTSCVKRAVHQTKCQKQKDIFIVMHALHERPHLLHFTREELREHGTMHATNKAFERYVQTKKNDSKRIYQKVSEMRGEIINLKVRKKA